MLLFLHGCDTQKIADDIAERGGLYETILVQETREVCFGEKCKSLYAVRMQVARIYQAQEEQEVLMVHWCWLYKRADAKARAEARAF